MKQLQILCLITTILSAVFFNPKMVLATDYYVAVNGSNTTGNGTISSPWATIQKACDYVAAGDIIYLRGGVYNRRDYIDANNDGTSENPIIIKNYNDEEVIFDGTGVSLGANAGLIYFARWTSNPVMQHFVFDGITVRNSPERGISFYKTDYLTIKNCKVYNIERRAIGGYGHYITIENNEVYNSVLENENGVMEPGGWAMNIYATTDYENGAPSQNITIRNNYVHNCWGEGIGPGEGSDNVLIEGNTVKDVFSVGIYADKATNTTIRNNHVYNTDPTYYRFSEPSNGISIANEISFQGGIYSPIQNLHVYNNLISNVRRGVGFWFDSSNSETANSYSNIVIAYNVIYQPTSQGIAIDDIPTGNTQPTGCVLKNNIVYKGSTQSTIGDLSAWSISHNDWVGGVPSFGSSSDFNGVPGFANPGISSLPDDFKLTSANSPCYQKGTPVTAITTEDFWHSTRSASSPSVGIHEASFSISPQYYVDASVAASGNGLSWATAFKTIQEAANSALKPGDIINIMPGTYTSDLNITKSGAEIIPVTTGISVFAHTIQFQQGTNLSAIDLIANPGEYYAYVYRSWKSNNGFYKIVAVDDANDKITVEGDEFIDETGTPSDYNKLSVSIGHPIIFKNAAANPSVDRVVIDIGATNSTTVFIGGYINNYDAHPADYNILTGFNLKKGGLYAGIHLQSSNHNVIHDFTINNYATSISDDGRSGILINGNSTRPANYNMVVDCHIFNTPYEGVYIGAGDHPQLNNHTHYNHVIDCEIYNAGSGATATLENAVDVKEYNVGNVVEGNYMHNIKQSTKYNGIIHVNFNAANSLIYNNKIESITKGSNQNEFYCLIVIDENTDKLALFNNILYNSLSAGYFAGLYVTPTGQSGSLIANNTVTGYPYGLVLNGGGTGITIANNIIDCDNPIEDWTGGAGVALKHNLYKVDPGYFPSEPGRKIGIPGFVAPANDDYHLTSGALAKDAGILTVPAVSLDFDHQLRNAIPDIGAFENRNITPQPMVYVSSSAVQLTDDVNAGTLNAPVLKIVVNTTGTDNPLNISKIRVNASGTTNFADIANARIFYTGNSDVFSDVNQYGAVKAAPTSTNFVMTKNQPLAEGANYFWLTYDVKQSAITGNKIDGQLRLIWVDGVSKTPTTQNPAGYRQVLASLIENTVQIGFGTNTTYKYGPIYRSRANSDYDYSRFSYLYTQTELAAAGIIPGSLITKIAWYKTNTANITNNGNAFFNLYMKNSGKTSLVNPTSWQTGVLSGATPVASKIFTKSDDPFATTGWTDFLLDQPFAYTGGSLEISADWNISAVTNNPTNGAFNFRFTDVAPGRTIAAAHTYAGGVSELVYRETDYFYGDADGSRRPNIKISYSSVQTASSLKSSYSLVSQSQIPAQSEKVNIYGFDHKVTIEYNELPLEELTAFIYNANGQLIISKPVSDLVTVIEPIHVTGLIVVKIQGSKNLVVRKIILK